MDEDRLAPIELRQKELFVRLDNLERNLKPKKDIWDIMSAATPLISGILISGIGLYFAYSNNQAQLKLQETQTIERFFPHLNGTEQEKKAAILAISSLTNTETAAKYAELFPSEGTASALRTIANSGSVQGHDKDVANKALANTFHKLADGYQAMQNTTQAVQAYQQSLAAQEKTVGADSPDLIDNLNQLVEIYKADHKYDLAESALKRILKIQKKTSGSHSADFIATLNKLSTVFRLEGKNDAADHITEFGNLLSQQNVPATVQAAPSSNAPAASATVNNTSDITQDLYGSDTANVTAAKSADQAGNSAAAPLETKQEPKQETKQELKQKAINNKMDSDPSIPVPKSATSLPNNANM